MTDTTRFFRWLAQSVIGRNPVWAPDGSEVGYITGPPSTTWFYLNPPFAAVAGAHLVTKDLLGKDRALTVLTAAPAATKADTVKIGFTYDDAAVTVPKPVAKIGNFEISTQTLVLAAVLAGAWFVLKDDHGGRR